MHLFFYLRGVYRQAELWKTLARGQYFKWHRTNLKTKKEEEVLVQAALRESVLGAYEYVFPETALPEVLSMMGLTSKKHGIDGKRWLRIATLRKMIGLSKIPDSAFKKAAKLPSSITIQGRERGISDLKIGGISIHPIGIMHDKRESMEDWGFEQEML